MLMTATTIISSMRVKPAWPTGRRWLRFTSFIAKPPFGSTGTYRRSGGRPVESRAQVHERCRLCEGSGLIALHNVGRRSASPETANQHRAVGAGHASGHRPSVGGVL